MPSAAASSAAKPSPQAFLVSPIGISLINSTSHHHYLACVAHSIFPHTHCFSLTIHYHSPLSFITHFHSASFIHYHSFTIIHSITLPNIAIYDYEQVAISVSVMTVVAGLVTEAVHNNSAVHSIFVDHIFHLVTRFVPASKIHFAAVFVGAVYLYKREKVEIISFEICSTTLLTKLPLNIAQAQEGKGYDNKKPREQQKRLTGWGLRALSAHLNSFEAFPTFAAAVFTAHLLSVPVLSLQKLSLLWIGARGLFYIFYYVNLDAFRTLSFFVATGAAFKLFLLALL